MFATVSEAAKQRIGDFNAHELANIAWAITNVRQPDGLMFMSRALSNSDQELGSAKWAVSIAGSSITNEPIKMSLRNCVSAKVKELASSELAMHVPLMSWIASMDSDRSVHFSKQIPQRAANLFVDGALSPANMAQVVLALKKLSQGGL